MLFWSKPSNFVSINSWDGNDGEIVSIKNVGTAERLLDWINKKMNRYRLLCSIFYLVSFKSMQFFSIFWKTLLELNLDEHQMISEMEFSVVLYLFLFSGLVLELCWLIFTTLSPWYMNVCRLRYIMAPYICKYTNFCKLAPINILNKHFYYHCFGSDVT